eukprot:gnl/Dysnectes_brevis/2344_a2764_507.p1 GENE.gnl/Dysnectes_brevis/2344_a2764_507~~gnl/Dysnectes_brevis/2344_a2764_507.p1  ORF type:complete len:455 (-),score=197.59 gnl/Dysnectes_brevis/2344_a2764_507:44-1408(-)
MTTTISGYVDILIGCQYGDEGKGKFSDVLASQFDIVARYAGGANAGHTIVTPKGTKLVLHVLPSGVAAGNTLNIIGSSCVVDLAQLTEEIEDIETRLRSEKLPAAETLRSRLVLSHRAQLVLPCHLISDRKQEDGRKEGTKIGTTGRGIGPTYSGRAARVGVTVAQMLLGEDYFVTKASRLRDWLGVEAAAFDTEAMRSWYATYIPLARALAGDAEAKISHGLRSGLSVLAEGAQGAMLDICFGTYPFVTSSHPVAGGAAVGLAVPMRMVRRIVGISKVYCTRVGGGSQIAKMDPATAKLVQDRGQEFGATTGRPRRCAWLDIPQLRYAVSVSGVSHLVLTKLDVLDTLETLRVCVGYRIGPNPPEGLGLEAGQVVTDYPAFTELVEEGLYEPVFEDLPGWMCDTSGITDYAKLPEKAQNLISYVQSKLDDTDCKIWMVSTGPGRQEVIEMPGF